MSDGERELGGPGRALCGRHLSGGHYVVRAGRGMLAGLCSLLVAESLLVAVVRDEEYWLNQLALRVEGFG